MAEPMSAARLASGAPRWAWAAWLALGVHRIRLGRFAIVGAIGVVVNTALLAILVEAVGVRPVIGTAIATEASILSNFTLNDRWTFRDRSPAIGWRERAWRYNLVALGGLLVSVAAVALLTHGLRLHYLAANGFGVGAGALWNYALGSRLAWASHAAPPRRGSVASRRLSPASWSTTGGRAEQPWT